jgi:type I restriction enzyme M protein
MARRHEVQHGVWESVATRLDELLCAHSGEDPFEEALKLLSAKLAWEASGGSPGGWLADAAGDEVTALNAGLDAAARRWPEVVAPGTRTRLDDHALARCAAALRTVRLQDGALAGLDTLVEVFVTRAAKGEKGQYFTPRHVVATAVRIVAPQTGERVVDPACGSGAFLHHAAAAAPGVLAYGADIDPRAVRVARLMLAASGQPASRVRLGDSLAEGAQDDADGLADIVLANPPFAGDVGDRFASSYALARGRRVERDVLFVERCVRLLRPGGRLGIVVPHNKVGGARWSFVREWLLRAVRVAGVVALGRHTFLPHTAQKACLIVGVKRARPLGAVPDDEIVRMFVSDRDGKDARGRWVCREDGTVDHDLDEAVPALCAAMAEG